MGDRPCPDGLRCLDQQTPEAEIVFMRFTIRDLLWLMVVVAMGVGWFVDHRQSRHWCELAITAADVLDAEGWTVSYTDESGPFFKSPDGKKLWRPDRFGGRITGMSLEHVGPVPPRD